VPQFLESTKVNIPKKIEPEVERLPISLAQVATFAKLINLMLSGDEELKDYLPI